MKTKIPRNPFLIFLPFLLFYFAVVIILYSNILWGDEIRHVSYAQNLLRGYYSKSGQDVNLDVGPGYPLFILPFLALHIPLICVNLMNAVFTYVSVVLLFKALEQIVSFNCALICSLFLAFYYNAYEFMALLYSESLTLFLISSVVFLIIKIFSQDNLIKTKRYIYLTGFLIGFLALAKIIFGYVLLLMFIGSGLLWLTNSKSINYRKCFFILLIGLAITSPYLIYTYRLTGRIFYWGTSGGNNLYWMATPFPGEYGNWGPIPKAKPDVTLIDIQNKQQNGSGLNIKNRENFIPGGEDSIRLHHQKDFETINKYYGAEKDDAYKSIVIKNIRSHPLKYVENCFSNIGRLLFNYPYSYKFQKPGTLFRLPMNGILVILMLFCLIPTFINWRKLIFPIRFMLFMILLYFGGSIVGSAETRMFTVIVPMILFWVAYVIQRSIKFNLKFEEKNKN